jgi:putative sigma-54 modulation protein
MNIVVNGRNVDVTPALKSYAEEKITRFDKYLPKITEAVVTLSIQKFRHKAEVLIKANGTQIQAEGETEELYSAIDEVTQKLDRQIKKLKGKLQTHRKTEGRARSAEPTGVGMEEASPETGRIVRKTVHAKPMSPEEAAIQMQTTNQEFMAFMNFESGDMNVIYRRSDGDLGLIEPVK